MLNHRQHLWDYAGSGPFFIHARKDFVIRTDAADPMVLANAVREVVADVDASVAIDNMMPMRQRLSPDWPFSWRPSGSTA